jgi:Transposase DDE domain group 1
MRKPLPNALELDFKGGLTSEGTPHAGVGLLIETGRRSGVMAAAEKYLPPKRSAKGLGQGQFVEAVVLLSALGGDCVDDFDNLRRDMGLRALTGYRLPAAPTVRQWLDRFHEEALLAGRPAQGSFIPRESDWLAGLRAVLQHSVRTYVSAMVPGPAVTLDVDAHLVESSKQQALPTYAGFRGFQPLLVSWAETGLVMADEFRDGNVPASLGIKDLVDEAYASLPARSDGAAWQVAVRSDSAAYAYAALDHWQARGWRFAVSADMSPQLRQAVAALPNTAWQVWAQEADGAVREWAEVAYVPSRVPEQRERVPYRYVAIRVRKAQGELFCDGNSSKHFAVVTNDWETDGQALLTWQRGKAGTIEHVNRTLKDELGAGVYPSGKFGANAAWLRLQCLTHNLLEAMKAVALEPQYRTARPKRLRFAIFTQFGRVVRHARQLWMRLETAMLEALLWPARGRVARAGWEAP